jgi:hypothetical protein
MTEAHMTLTQLAKELGISKGQASKCAKRGMPCDDVEAARRWRRRNLEPMMVASHQARKGKPYSTRPDRTEADSEGRPTNPIDIVTFGILPYLFFQPELIRIILLEAGITLTPDQACSATDALAKHYHCVLTKMCGAPDFRLNLPDNSTL